MPIAAKGSKNAFRLPKQKLLIDANTISCKTSADGSLEDTFYHHQTANAFLLPYFFFCHRLICGSVSQFTSAVWRESLYHQQGVNDLLLPTFFSLPTWRLSNVKITETLWLLLCSFKFDAFTYSIHLCQSPCCVK